MNFTRTPRWVWYLCGAGTVAGLLPLLFRDRSAEVSKPKSFVSIYGEPVTYSDEQVLWVTGQPTSYVVTMRVSASADAEQKTKQADELFSYYEGPHADDLGFKRVVIQPDTGTHPGEIDIFGFKFWLRVDVGPGPATEEDLEDGIIYEKESDGVWSRGGYKPDAPFHVQDVALSSGARFALTYSMEDNPSGWFVYECLSCRAPNGNMVFAENLYPLLQMTAKIADRDHLSKLSVAIFAAARKSTWQFPTILHVNMAQRAGQWIVPKLSSKQIETLLVQYAEKMRAKGAAFRHERL